ncbi:unnamed protein product, partial [Discosporangium mesarthrocarpum]
MSWKYHRPVNISPASACDVILSPVITEKATMGSEHNQVTFRVPLDASKPAIRAAVEHLFKVKVKAVNTIRQQGKTKRFRGMVGKRPDYKKAVVTLEEGNTIDSELWKGRPVKKLTEGVTKSGGRNNNGRITSRRRGGGHKRLYRIIDFKRTKFDVSAVVERIEYDPNRSAFIALLKYDDGEQAYILAPQRLQEGDRVIAANRADIKPGNAMPMENMPVGTIIHNVEMKPGRGGQMARAAGTYVQLIGKDSGFAQLRLTSGELRMVPAKCMATVGAVSNSDNKNQNMSKAGRSRWLGKRPKVRGVAMNPVDHPHGGGEGRTSGGRHPVSPWGKPTKGARTRRKKKSDDLIMRRPFVDGYLLKKAEETRASGRNDVIKIWSRRSTVLPQFVGL